VGEYKIAVMGVSEVRWNGSRRTETTNGSVFLYSGMPNADDDHIRGVGILVNKNIRGALLEWNPVSERIITARIQNKLRKMSIVQCYAPTENTELSEKEAFYSLLDKTLMGIRRSDIIVMMGDFNAQVWNNNQDIEHVMGRHGMPCDKENENGQLLIELCGKHGLVIGGTIFPHKEGHKVTWISPDKDKQGGNQIDHICISRNWRKALLDVRNKKGADIGSDHHMIMGILRIRTQKVIKRTINRWRYNLKRLEDIECQKTFKTKLREGASTLRHETYEGVEEKWERIKTTFQHISENTLGQEDNTRKDWISDSTWKMIERRKQTKGKLCATYARTRKGKELEKEYAALSKEIKKNVRKDH
jgi:hypothetical protein